MGLGLGLGNTIIGIGRNRLGSLRPCMDNLIFEGSEIIGGLYLDKDRVRANDAKLINSNCLQLASENSIEIVDDAIAFSDTIKVYNVENQTAETITGNATFNVRSCILTGIAKKINDLQFFAGSEQLLNFRVSEGEGNKIFDTLKFQGYDIFEFQNIPTSNNTTLTINVNNSKRILADWGDGKYSILTTFNLNSDLTNIYSVAGTYNCRFVELGESTNIRFRCTDGALRFNVANFPNNVKIIYISGQNTLTGDIANLSNNITYILISGQNTVTGDIANFTNNVTSIYISGQNTVTGDIANFTNNVTSIHISGQNTVTGDIANFPNNVTSIHISGQNTVTGDIANLSNNITYIVIYGQNTVTYSSRNWGATISQIFLRPGFVNIFTSQMTDQLLIDVSNSGTLPINERTIDLRGNCGARTSASDTAVADLQTKGFTILTN